MKKYETTSIYDQTRSSNGSWFYIETGDFAVCFCVRPVIEANKYFAERLSATANIKRYWAYRHCPNCFGYGSQPIPMSEVR